MAIEAIVCKALVGHSPAPGARSAVNDLELDDYGALFANRTIHIGTRDDPVEKPRATGANSVAWSEADISQRANSRPMARLGSSSVSESLRAHDI